FSHSPHPALPTLSLHDALPIYRDVAAVGEPVFARAHPAQRLALEVDLAARRLVHAREEPRDRALAAAALAHERDDLAPADREVRSEEHTSELQSRGHLVCRLLL